MVQQGSCSLATSEFPLPTNPYPTSVLEQDPDSTEARKALDETFAFISKRDSEEDESIAEDVIGPSLTDPGKVFDITITTAAHEVSSASFRTHRTTRVASKDHAAGDADSGGWDTLVEDLEEDKDYQDFEDEDVFVQSIK
ncbi:hypothetical protein EDB86DRAFT_3087617 [Lactarius hatsudake]|nr:hypothetical protein EDB86DRAFT_3087617 [Lactarius hatsudake]